MDSENDQPIHVMGFEEAKGVLTQQIRRQTGMQILIETLDAAERGNILLRGLQAEHTRLDREIAALNERHNVMIAEAKAAAEHEARAVMASYDRHVAVARGQLESVHQEIQQAQEGFTQAVAAHEEQKKAWMREQEDHQAVMVACQQEIERARQDLVALREQGMVEQQDQDTRREAWLQEGHRLAASRDAVQQEIATLLRRLSGETA